MYIKQLRRPENKHDFELKRRKGIINGA